MSNYLGSPHSWFEIHMAYVRNTDAAWVGRSRRCWCGQPSAAPTESACDEHKGPAR